MRSTSKLRTGLQQLSTKLSTKPKAESALSAEEQMVQVESWLSITPTAQGSSEDFCARHATRSLDT
jgi:hypothetical protein